MKAHHIDIHEPHDDLVVLDIGEGNGIPTPKNHKEFFSSVFKYVGFALDKFGGAISAFFIVTEDNKLLGLQHHPLVLMENPKLLNDFIDMAKKAKGYGWSASISADNYAQNYLLVFTQWKGENTTYSTYLKYDLEDQNGKMKVSGIKDLGAEVGYELDGSPNDICTTKKFAKIVNLYPRKKSDFSGMDLLKIVPSSMGKVFPAEFSYDDFFMCLLGTIKQAMEQDHMTMNFCYMLADDGKILATPLEDVLNQKDVYDRFLSGVKKARGYGWSVCLNVNGDYMFNVFTQWKGSDKIRFTTMLLNYDENMVLCGYQDFGVNIGHVVTDEYRTIFNNLMEVFSKIVNLYE
jgi:hypothetical protein